MQGIYRPYRPDQKLLLPPSLQDWLPEGHLAYFISDTIDQLDISKFDAHYRGGGKGNVAYHPRLMLKLLVYAYATGVFSSRKIAEALEDRVAFRVLAAGATPSHRTFARFRRDHLAAFEALFVQVVQIAVSSGLAKLGTLAVDGSKVRANASKHKAMSYERMQEKEAKLRKEIRALTARAANCDAEEDVEFGPDFRGDEVPEELKRRKDRLRVIREAKARLEARKKEEAEPQIEAEKKAKDEDNDSDKPRRSPKRKHPLGKPKPKDQENFTDPESRIMKTGQGFQQCYNTQIAVDGDHGIIVAVEVGQCAADHDALLPMIDAAVENTGLEPDEALADAGYRSEANFLELEKRNIRAYIPLGRRAGKKTRVVAEEMVATKRMERRMASKRGRKKYRKRKHIAEPPFGWIKAGLGFRAFLLPGLSHFFTPLIRH